MKVKCYSVRLMSLTEISPKCYKAVCFDGTSDLIPKSQFFGPDYNVIKSDAYWISAWILSKKNIQYSSKKEAFFYSDTGKKCHDIKITKHIPKSKINETIDKPTELFR